MARIWKAKVVVAGALLLLQCLADRVQFIGAMKPKQSLGKERSVPGRCWWWRRILGEGEP